MDRQGMGQQVDYVQGDDFVTDKAGQKHQVTAGSDYIYGRSQAVSTPAANNQNTVSSSINNNTPAGAINAMATGTGTGPVNAPKKKRQKRQKTVKQPGLKGSTLGKTPKQKSQKKQKNQGPPTSKQPGTRGSTLGKAMRPGKAERLERREERQKFKAAKKLVKERDADGKGVNYAFNAPRDIC